MIDVPCWCIYSPDEGSKWSRWAIGRMECLKSVVRWSLHWRRDRPHHQRRIQCQDNSFGCCGDRNGMRKPYCYPSCDVWECLWCECSEARSDWEFVVWENCQDWSIPHKVKPSTCLHISSNWIISMIDFITDIMHQALAKITCSHAAMVYHCQTSIDFINRFWTKSPTVIEKMVVWLYFKDSFTCPTNICEVRSKLHSWVIVVFKINFRVQVSICSDSQCGF